jgi:hypothetical protein
MNKMNRMKTTSPSLEKPKIEYRVVSLFYLTTLEGFEARR